MLSDLLTTAANEFSPPEIINSYEWLQNNYSLPSVTGFSGLYRFDLAPYFIGVAMALDDKDFHEIDLMKAAQIGWTFFILGYVLERIETEPCPILGIFAKEKDAKAFHDEKLVPTVVSNPDCPMDVSTSRKSGNRWDLKSFPGGYLKLVGSNSPGNVKSTSSVGVALIEEPDDTSDNVAGQGDAIGLAEERLKRYTGNKKLIVGGTPAVKGLSKTEARLEQSDKRVLPVVCHHCGNSHVLSWDNVTWVGKSDEIPFDRQSGEIKVERHPVYGFQEPETAIYVCPDCGEHWDDYQRQKNIRTTVYDAVAAGDKYAGWTPTQRSQGVAGFTQLSELYACIPGTSLSRVVQEYLLAEHEFDQGKVELMIKFYNQKLGLPYEFKSDAPDADALADRAEDYREMTVPEGGLILTAGVDVQHDRLAIVIRAWGRGEESWLVYWGELAAKRKTSDPTDPVWQELHNILVTPIKSERGYSLRIKALSIDASDGNTNDQVYNWVRQHVRMNVLAIKGSSNDYGNAEIYSRPKPIDQNSKSKAAKYGLAVYIVGTQKARDLLIGDHGRISLIGNGPGRMHFYKEVRADYYEQLMSHVKAPHKSIRNKLVWQKKSGVRDEAGDCEVYALHAARHLKLHRYLPDAWDKLEQGLLQEDLFSEPAENPAPVKTAEPRRNNRVVSKGVEL